MTQANGWAPSAGHGRSSPSTDQPPSYESLMEAAEVEAAWDHERPAHWLEGKCNLLLQFKSQHSIFSRLVGRAGPSWSAQLEVKAKNIPRLMRRGFYWSPADIQKGDDHIELDLKFATAPKPVHRGKDAPTKWNHVRTRRLRDHSGDGEWFALLHVFAMEVETLLNFDLELLTMDRLRRQVAYDWNREVVYWAHRSDKRVYNITSQQAPVGWWLGGTVEISREEGQRIFAKKEVTISRATQEQEADETASSLGEQQLQANAFDWRERFSLESNDAYASS